MQPYNKLPLTFTEQVNLLKSRGLVISDQNAAEIYLSQINYYRFSAYCLPFEITRHNFKPNVTFEQVKALYKFDCELRRLIYDALEIIENITRTVVAYHLSIKYKDPFVHEKPANFYSDFKHSEWIYKIHEEAERSHETFIEHYKRTYVGFSAIPIWMAVEIMAFGSLSKLVAGMLRQDQIAISDKFGLHSSVFISWLHTMAYIRNICAHHSRLWNRELAIAMLLPKNKDWNSQNPKRIGSVIFAANFIISRSTPFAEKLNTWRKEVENILLSPPPVSDFYLSIGLPENWKEHPLWKR